MHDAKLTKKSQEKTSQQESKNEQTDANGSTNKNAGRFVRGVKKISVVVF